MDMPYVFVNYNSVRFKYILGKESEIKVRHRYKHVMSASLIDRNSGCAGCLLEMTSDNKEIIDMFIQI